MTDPQDLLRLADSVEKTARPDRRLDITIAIAVGAVRADYERASQHGEALPYFWHKTDSHAPLWMPERYTASLDAAMTLVPEGWVPTVTIYHDCATAILADDRVHPVRLDNVEVYASTAPLAIVAAALKARAHSTKDTSNVG